jgi:hypothetical protein
MRSLTDDLEIVEVPGTTVAEVIQNLDLRFPGIQQRLCEGDAMRAGFSVVVSGSIAPLGLLQRTEADVEIHFLPAIGGGH